MAKPVADDAVLKTSNKKKYLLWAVGLLLLLGAIGGIVGGIIAVRRSRQRDVFPAFRGVSYTPWGSDVASSTNSRASIQAMKDANINMVALNTFSFIEDQDDTGPVTLDTTASSRTNYSTDDAGLVEGIRYIRAQGMDVFFKPNLDLKDAQWRGKIPASDGFFRSYKEWMVSRAVVAQSNGVSILSVGTEFNGAQGDEAAWRDIVAAVREVYDGQLTYSANHDSYQEVAWWDAVDMIGIDAYFPLTENEDDEPSKPTIQQRWVDQGEQIGMFRNKANLRTMPVIFAEAGYRSATGATTESGHDGGANQGDRRDNVNLDLQADAYDALLGIMGGHRFDWWQGAFFWNWEVNPRDNEDTYNSWTPQGKPALQVMTEFYQKWAE